MKFCNGNPADYLSRHPVDPATKNSDDIDLYVNFIIDNSIPRAVTRDQLVKATAADAELRSLADAVKLGDHKKVKNDATLRDYNSVFDQLTVSDDGIVLRRHQIVVPKSVSRQSHNQWTIQSALSSR